MMYEEMSQIPTTCGFLNDQCEHQLQSTILQYMAEFQYRTALYNEKCLQDKDKSHYFKDQQI